jgi:molecular chaperone DnaK
MGYWLGIDVGTTVTAAAVCRENDPAEVIALSDGSAVVPSVVYLGNGGQVVVGTAAVRHAVTDPDRVVRGFIGRIGDEVPMVIAGHSYTAAQLAAMLIGWVVDLVASQHGGPAVGIMVTHPVTWGDYKRQVLATALASAGLHSVRVCPEPHAAAAGYATTQPITPGQTVAVYDLGGSTFHATVLRASGPTEFTTLGSPHSLAQLGGANFDDAVFGHVLAATPALAELDADDPATLAATATLRRQCTLATQALSADTEVTIPVTAPGITTSVRLHRAEFDDMIRPQLAETIHALHRTLDSAQLLPNELNTMLLVGGSSRVPLVAQLLSSEFNQPVTIDTDPTTTVARGAATLAAPGTHLDNSSPPPPAATTTAFSEPEDNPPPPSLTAIPLDIEAVGVQRRRTNSRRATRIAVSSVLAVFTVAGVATVPFLIARSDPDPSATVGTPAPSAPPPPVTGMPAPDASPIPDPASPVVSPGTGGEINTTTIRSSEVVRKTPAAAPHQLADPPANPDPATVHANAPAPDWVTTYTWTTSWSNPPPTPTRTTIPATAAPTTTTSAPPPTTRPRPTTTTAAPPTTSSTHPRRPPT